MKNHALLLVLSIFVAAFISIPTAAQTRRKPRKTAVKTAAKKTNTAAEPQTSSENAAPTENPQKKNERANAPAPTESNDQNAGAPIKKNVERANQVADKTALPPSFAYEFAQPKFQISKVSIEHDERGVGKITFQKQDLNEPIIDPLQISEKSLEKIKSLWNELNFLTSSEDYQTPDKDFSHLGTMKLRRAENDKKREAVFNWTENKAAKDLTDEYKKLTEQFVWIFEMNLARENFPLNSPKLIDNFESLMRRNLISDNQQMLLFLREVADDERLPLIARNHTKKIVERIEKEKIEKK